MTKKHLYGAVSVSAVAAALMLATAAQAQPDAPWTGFHVGAGGGADLVSVRDRSHGTISNNNNNFNGSISGSTFADLGKVGAFGTVEGGYDYQMNKWVVGAFANYDFGSTTVSHGATFSNTNGNFAITAKESVNVGGAWAVGARLGYTPLDRVLVFADAGVTGTTVEQRMTFTAFSFGPTFGGSVSHNSDRTGYFVGAGAEAMVAPHWSLKGEFRYADFGTATNAIGNPNVNGVVQSSEVSESSVRAVLSYYFK